MEINKNLIKFTKEMILFCKSHGVTPIICGSYLTKYYTQDERIVVHDVDMYVPDAFLPKAIKLLEKKKIKYKHLKEWGCLKVYKGNVNIDLDALNFLYKGPKDEDIELAKIRAEKMGLPDWRVLVPEATEKLAAAAVDVNTGRIEPLIYKEVKQLPRTFEEEKRGYIEVKSELNR